jgi:hypothetical protein
MQNFGFGGAPRVVVDLGRFIGAFCYGRALLDRFAKASNVDLVHLRLPFQVWRGWGLGIGGWGRRDAAFRVAGLCVGC